MSLIFDCSAIAGTTNFKANFTETAAWPRLIHISWILLDENSKPTVPSNPTAQSLRAGQSYELPNGKVLTVGGTPELFDPANGQYTTTGPMGTPHSGAQLVRLASGKILVVGGGVAASSLYDAATNTFSPGPAMTTARTGHTATLLGNGKVLVTGGNTASAELYDPATGATGAFTATGSMTTARTGHVAVLLPNGKVLVVGGATASAELYDPATGQFSATGSMIEPRPGLVDQNGVKIARGVCQLVNSKDAAAAKKCVETFEAAKAKFDSTIGKYNAEAGDSSAKIGPRGLPEGVWATGTLLAERTFAGVPILSDSFRLELMRTGGKAKNTLKGTVCFLDADGNMAQPATNFSIDSGSPNYAQTFQGVAGLTPVILLEKPFGTNGHQYQIRGARGGEPAVVQQARTIQ